MIIENVADEGKGVQNFWERCRTFSVVYLRFVLVERNLKIDGVDTRDALVELHGPNLET